MPFTPYYKSFSHTKAQIRIATLGDKFLSNLCAALGTGYSNYTTYEYPFPRIYTSLGFREYKADVYFEVIDTSELFTQHQYHLCVESDGKVNHDSPYAQMKDRVRDFSLHEKLQCETVRFSTWDISGHKWRKIRKKGGRKVDTKPMEDIEILTEMNMIKLMKLPVPNSNHWNSIVHSCLHNACISIT